MTEYAYTYNPQLSPWIGRFESRVAAEETARDSAFEFVMVWTAEIRDVTLGDLISGEHLLSLLSEGLHQGAYSNEANVLEGVLNELPPDAINILEAEVGEVVDEWSNRILGGPVYPVYVNVQPGWYVVNYEAARQALVGKNQTYSDDSPVQSETHYMTLAGRIGRFRRHRKRVDLKGESLDARIETMIEAMVEWDTKLPLPGLAKYEKRIREIKHVLRSPWPSLGIYARDEHGKRNYLFSDQCWTEEEHTNRAQYTQLQRELQWLKWRVTKIYVARTLAKSSGAGRSHLSCSEIALSTEARSR